MSEEQQDTGSTTGQGVPATPGTPGRRAVRWLRIFLIASLSLNVLFITFAATRAYHFHHNRFRDAGEMGLVMREGRRFMRDMSRDRRHELVDMLRDHRSAFRAERDQVGDAVRNLATVLGSDTFDQSALETALATLGERIDGMVDRGSEATHEVLMALSEEERKEFSERLLNRLP